MPKALPQRTAADYEPADELLGWSKKLLICLVFAGLLWLSASLLASFLNGVAGGPPGNLRNAMPFVQRWLGSSLIIAFMLLFFGAPVFLFLGGWIAFYPPRQLRQRWFFVLAIMVAGSLGGWLFQWLGAWDFESGKAGDLASPPVVTTMIYAVLLGWMTALSASAFCYWIVKRWLKSPPSNHAVH